MKKVRITCRKFVKLTGVLGVDCVNRSELGTTWRLPNGLLASEIFDGENWLYFAQVPEEKEVLKRDTVKDMLYETEARLRDVLQLRAVNVDARDMPVARWRTRTDKPKTVEMYAGLLSHGVPFSFSVQGKLISYEGPETFELIRAELAL